jgi:hypothetical protein
MCYGCYSGLFHKAKVDNKLVRKTAYWIDEVYKGEICGGGLHTVIDDWNVENVDIEDIRYIMEDRKDRSRTQKLIELICWSHLMVLSVKERASALAIHCGYWNPDDPKDK